MTGDLSFRSDRFRSSDLSERLASFSDRSSERFGRSSERFERTSLRSPDRWFTGLSERSLDRSGRSSKRPGRKQKIEFVYFSELTELFIN